MNPETVRETIRLVLARHQLRAALARTDQIITARHRNNIRLITEADPDIEPEH